MSVIISFVGFLASSLFLFISFQVKEEVESQVTRMMAIVIFLLTFLISPLFIKLLVTAALLFAWSYIGDRLGMSFYRQINK